MLLLQTGVVHLNRVRFYLFATCRQWCCTGAPWSKGSIAHLCFKRNSELPGLTPHRRSSLAQLGRITSCDYTHRGWMSITPPAWMCVSPCRCETMPLDCWYALCTTLYRLCVCVYIMPGARRWPVRLSCQSAGSRWRLMERANNKRLAMIINMLMAIINTHSLTCIEESMCVCTVFMQQRFGIGGWFRLLS